MKKNLLRIIAILLILAGIVILLMPMLSEYLIQNKMEEVAVVTRRLTHDHVLENLERPATFDFSAIEDVDVLSTIRAQIDESNDAFLGQLIIPSIEADLSILKGVSNDNLNIGVSTMREDQRMGVGNYPLAGHITKNKHLLFGGLMDIQIGDMAYISDRKDIYEYRIYATAVVPDTALYMIEDAEAEKHGKPILSMMTCYYSSKTNKRFFALGELVRQVPIQENQIDMEQQIRIISE